MKTVILKNGLTIGGDSPVRINCNVGCNQHSDYAHEIEKLYFLKDRDVLPDMMMDLSLATFEHPIYETIRDDLKLPFGTVLSYHSNNIMDGIVWKEMRSALIKLCENGISFVTVHFTADADLFVKAKNNRLIPITSRGGGIVLNDTIKNHRNKNIFQENIDEIISIVKQYDVAISIGTTFRPGSIHDACDEVHIEETKRQLETCRYLQRNEVKTIVENVGHISIDKLAVHTEMLKRFNAPIMPLGPLPTDSAIDIDHIANAIGGAIAGYYGVAHIINCVSRYEHSQSNITPEATLEAIQSAKLAAHIADLSKGNVVAKAIDYDISRKRGELHNCFADGSDCSRCSNVCPLKLNADD